MSVSGKAADFCGNNSRQLKVNGFTFRGSSLLFSVLFHSLIEVDSLRKEFAPVGANSFL